MKSDIRVFLCDDDNLRFFGEGPCRLLHLIEETGSLRAAALSMGMAYTKALHLMKRAEKNLGFSLTARTIGGKGGGGSVLTPEAKEFLHDYETWRNACIQSSRDLYTQVLSKYNRNSSGAKGGSELSEN
ncbi:LysR family transcriptional regulator [Clostridium sp. AF37-5AT]|nr:LysR family transcriptional regulator [Clostridium sp. AF37-5AT]RHO96829.1 LysR family transcriptional regulator [Clostridium sp. AF37-5AT]